MMLQVCSGFHFFLLGSLPIDSTSFVQPFFFAPPLSIPSSFQSYFMPMCQDMRMLIATELETQDFEKIFAFMPNLYHVNFRFAGQLKDKVVEYLLDRNLKIKRLQLDAANLISDECWQQLFRKLGPQLESLKLSNLDSSLDDETVEVMCRECTSLQRLKLKQCWKMGNRSLQAISQLISLQHLSLDFVQEICDEILLNTVSKLSPRLLGGAIYRR
jgi:DNA repair protein RAD7